MLMFLPVIATFLIIIMDLLTIFYIDAAVRFPHIPLYEYSKITGKGIEWGQFVIMKALALFFGILTTILCSKIFSFEKATANIKCVFLFQYLLPFIHPNMHGIHFIEPQHLFYFSMIWHLVGVELARKAQIEKKYLKMSGVRSRKEDGRMTLV
jgi:hypothetical protein